MRRLTALAASAGVAVALAGCEPSDDESYDSPPLDGAKSQEAPLALAGEETSFVPGVLHEGGEFTSVRVTLENKTDGKQFDVNPHSFSLVGESGERRQAVTGEDDRQIELSTIYPGEHATGVITVKGDIDPAKVTFDDYNVVVHGQVG